MTSRRRGVLGAAAVARGGDDGALEPADAAPRIAFSTVKDARGARPDRPLVEAAPAAVRAAVTYGRPVAAADSAG